MGGMWRNGREALEISHVNISPCACPTATVVWSADMANEVTAPASTAVTVN